MVIPFLIAAIIFIVIAVTSRRSYREHMRELETCEKTYATIERTYFSDTGDKGYYVKFCLGGENATVDAGYYKAKTAMLHPGDQVKIGYYYSKTGRLCAGIQDDRVESYERSIPAGAMIFGLLGGALLLFSVVMIIINILP